MSFFSWFSRSPAKSAPARNVPRGVPPAAANAAGQARAFAPKLAEHAEQLARKNVRMERREALYVVVRDSMVRAGVLSAGYKFKVLSLDQQGQQFVVMIDLAREYGSSTARLSEIEGLITQSAKARFEILVTAVYWRMNDTAGVGVHMRRAVDKEVAAATASATPQTIRAPIMPAGSYEARASAPAPLRSNSGSAPLNSARAPLLGTHSGRAPLSSAPAPLTASPTTAPSPLAPSRSAVRPNGQGGGVFDPIEDDEVTAFKRALNSAASTPGSARVATAAERPGTTVRSGPRSRSPLLQPSGFADTEMPERDSASPDLSATQYGDLN